MALPIAYRLVLTLLWVLAAYNSLACRGLFWDGAAFLAKIVETGNFHDFYPARAHVGWVTQLPVLLAIRFGVVDTRLLAEIQSVALFALPTALYHVALSRARGDGVLFAIVLATIALVYLPTSFFIIGEYNAAYAASIATVTIALTSDRHRLRDGMLLAGLGFLCLRSYEAMLYLGPLLAAVALWWRGRLPPADSVARLSGAIAAMAFAGSTVMTAMTLYEYWHHPHFAQVRVAILDFWQNLQFIIPVVGLALFAAASLLWPRWLQGRGPAVLICAVAVILAIVPWLRPYRPEAMLFPPSHYVARTAAGCLLWALLVVMAAHVLWQRNAPRLLVILRQEDVGRRLSLAMAVLVVAATLPDLSLTRLWSDYLTHFRGLVAGQTGYIRTADLPTEVWPARLFSQDWTAPALGAVLRSAPGQAIVLSREGPVDTMPFDSRCGTVPSLRGYAWRD